MLLDALNLLSGDGVNAATLTGQTVTAVGATASTNAIDLAPNDIGQHMPGDLGAGQPLYVVVHALADLASAGAATLQIQLVLADDPNLATNLALVYLSRVYAYTEVKRTTDLSFTWPRLRVGAPQRYAGLRFVIAGAPLTAGSFWAATTTDRDSLGPIFNTRWSIA